MPPDGADSAESQDLEFLLLSLADVPCHYDEADHVVIFVEIRDFVGLHPVFRTVPIFQGLDDLELRGA